MIATFKHFSEYEALTSFQKILSDAKFAKMIDFHYHAEVNSLPYIEWSIEKDLIEDIRNARKPDDEQSQ